MGSIDGVGRAEAGRSINGAGGGGRRGKRLTREGGVAGQIRERLELGGSRSRVYGEGE